MRRRALLIAVACSVTPLAARAVYKCTAADGKVSFQQTPCERREQQHEVQIKNTTSRPADKPTSIGDGSPRATTTTASPSVDERMAASLRRERRARELEYSVATLESAIDQRNAQMAAEIEALRQRGASARNNLAGATWQQSLATEMQAVTAKYKALNDTDQERLKVLRADLEATKKRPP